MNINFSVLFNFFRGKTYFILCLALTWVLFHFNLKVFGFISVLYDIVLLAVIINNIDDELDGFWELFVLIASIVISIVSACILQYIMSGGVVTFGNFGEPKLAFGGISLIFGFIALGTYICDIDDSSNCNKIPHCWNNIKKRMKGQK